MSDHDRTVVARLYTRVKRGTQAFFASYGVFCELRFKDPFTVNVISFGENGVA